MRAVIFPAASPDPENDLRTALNPVVFAALQDLHSVQIAARAALDLPAMEIALDCVGETHACLNTVMHQYADAQVLIAPSVQRAGDETVVTFLYFDPRGSGEFRSVVRRYHGEDVTRQALDGVPEILRELLGMASPQRAEPESARERTAPASERNAFPLLPVVLMASGAVLIGVGAAFGLASHANERDYMNTLVDDRPAADAAIDIRDSAHRQARFANIGYGAGAVVLALGATLLIVDLAHSPDRASASVSAAAGPRDLGVLLNGHFPRTW